MPSSPHDGMSHCDRQFSGAELSEIAETVKCFSSLHRTELAETICEHLGWYTPTGSYKTTACLKLLERLAEEGRFTLPGKLRQKRTPKKPRIPPEAEKVDEQPEIVESELPILGRVSLELVEGKIRHGEWKRLVDRYHYLGYKKPFGCVVRYFIGTSRGLAGCVQYAGAAKAVAVRDQWIGWGLQHRRRNRGWVINNNRYLIFPWFRVPNLASHVLGQVSRRIGDDWERLWGYRPVLLETFVDPAKYRGSSYRGAGWTYLGLTSGEGLVRPGRQYETSPKMVFVYPLQPDFREQLCSTSLVGRVLE
jgi:hypothetical protein